MSQDVESDDFYDQTPEEQGHRLESLARAALGNWDLGADPDIELIKHRENAVFKIDSGDHRYALRVHRAGYHSDIELESELAWMAAISRDEIRTPKALATRNGAAFASAEAAGVPEPRQVDVLEWFDGEPLASIEDGFADPREIETTFALIGELMASTHNHSESWRRPEWFRRHAWDEDGIVGEEPLWGRYWDLEHLTDEQRARLGAAKRAALSELAAFGKSADRYGLIHADFLPENLLRGAGGICLIDFDDAGFGWHVFDLATTLFFHLGEEHFNAATGALIEGYRSRRPLPEEHVQKLPLFLLLRGLTYLAWAHSRSETETARELTPMVVAAVDELAKDYLS